MEISAAALAKLLAAESWEEEMEERTDVPVQIRLPSPLESFAGPSRLQRCLRHVILSICFVLPQVMLAGSQVAISQTRSIPDPIPDAYPDAVIGFG